MKALSSEVELEFEKLTKDMCDLAFSKEPSKEETNEQTRATLVLVSEDTLKREVLVCLTKE